MRIRGWPYIIEGVLFTHRVSKHTSTKFSPLFLLYNHEPILPIDIKYALVNEGNDSEQPFDKETFHAVLSSSKSIQEEVYQVAGENILCAQEKQQRNYNRRHTVPKTIKIDQSVLLKNQRREDRKGGKFSFKWFGPYKFHTISSNNICSLKNREDCELKTKYNISLLKPYTDCDESDTMSETKPTLDENTKRCNSQNDQTASDAKSFHQVLLITN